MTKLSIIKRSIKWNYLLYPRDILEIIFSKLSFTDKVNFTSIPLFRFLQTRCPNEYLTELASLFLSFILDNQEDMISKYHKVRVPYLIQKLQDKNYKLVTGKEYIHYSLYNDKKQRIIFVYPMFGLTKIKNQPKDWMVQIVIDHKHRFEYFYRKDTNLHLTEITYYENNIPLIVAEPINSESLDINLMADFREGKSHKTDNRSIYRLSSLFDPYKNEIKTYGSLNCYDMVSYTGDNITSRKVTSIEKDDLLYKIYFKKYNPLIYKTKFEPTQQDLPDYKSILTKEMIDQMRKYITEFGVQNIIYNIFEDWKIGFSYTILNKDYIVVIYYNGIKHGPVYKINKYHELFVGYHNHGIKTDTWYINDYVITYLEDVEIEKEYLIKELIDPCNHEIATKIENWSLLQYPESLPVAQRPHIEDNNIIRYECITTNMFNLMENID